MRRDAGFTILELLVAVAITIIIVAVSLSALTQAQRASEGISLMSNMTENLRAGMDEIEHDFVLAGSGIPIGGISIPNGGGPAINRPSPTGFAYTFPVGSTAIPAVTPGAGLGPLISGAVNSDMVTLIYADNQTFGPLNPPVTLNANFINDPAAVPPTTPCNGTIDPNGLSATFDNTCIVFNAGNGAVQAGDLIMFSNAQGDTIEYVTSVNGQTMNFAAGDPYGLNGRNDPAGTIFQLQSSSAPNPVTYPPTTATRIWMVSYFLDNTNPAGPRLMRRVNFSPAQPVAESIEALWITYNFVNGNPLCGATCTNQPQPPAGMTANQMMSANLFLGARSNRAFSWTQKFFRSNLVSQVSLRGLAFVNNYR